MQAIRAEARVRRSTRHEMEESQAREGNRRIIRHLKARNEVAPAVRAALERLTAAGPDGVLVSELDGTCNDKEATMLFDELTKLCIARICIHNRSWRMLQPGAAVRRTASTF